MTGRDEARHLFDQLTAATERMAGTIRAFAPASLRGDSLLPGWSRAHLLTHVARNADGARNLLLSVRSGQPVRMYPSPEARAADIEAGAGRPPEVVIEDALESSQRFIIDAASLAPESWNGVMPAVPGYDGSPATRPLSMRLREVELHHVDLDAGYDFGDTPEALLADLLEDTIKRHARSGFVVERLGDANGEWSVTSDGTEQRISASSADVMAWLSGRSRVGAISSAGPLPEVPSLD